MQWPAVRVEIAVLAVVLSRSDLAPKLQRDLDA
jgi:hypothetical protein